MMSVAALESRITMAVNRLEIHSGSELLMAENGNFDKWLISAHLHSDLYTSN